MLHTTFIHHVFNISFRWNEPQLFLKICTNLYGFFTRLKVFLIFFFNSIEVAINIIIGVIYIIIGRIISKARLLASYRACNGFVWQWQPRLGVHRQDDGVCRLIDRTPHRGFDSIIAQIKYFLVLTY